MFGVFKDPVAAAAELLVDALWSWWRGADLRSRIVSGLAVVGLALIAVSMIPGPGPDDAWLRDVLMTVGASIALFAPFYLLTRSLDRHLDQVATETAQQVVEARTEAQAATDELSGQVQALRTHVDERLADVADQVAARLDAEAAADTAAFDALRTAAPTREVLIDAITRAVDLGLVTMRHPPRVLVSEHAHLYVSVEYYEDDWNDREPLQLRVEDQSGRVYESIEWTYGSNAVDVLVDVGRAFRKHTSEPFPTAAFFTHFADLLDAANSHAERRPAIQICPPQWMVTDWGVITYDRRVYGVQNRQLHESQTIDSHVAEKHWVDADSFEVATAAARSLFPYRADDPWATPTAADDPP